jgi:hypothetical protein
MTQPTPAWSPSSEDELRRFLERGSRTILRVERAFAAPPVRLGALDPVTVDVPGTEEIVGQIKGGGGARDAHVTVRFTYTEQPEFSALVFVNTEGATANSSITDPGYVGAVAFFWHHEGETSIGFRLPATVPLATTKRSTASTVTVVPIGYPDQQASPHDVDVTIALELVESTVTRNK